MALVFKSAIQSLSANTVVSQTIPKLLFFFFIFSIVKTFIQEKGEMRLGWSITFLLGICVGFLQVILSLSCFFLSNRL